jgi:hypothetical protein
MGGCNIFSLGREILQKGAGKPSHEATYLRTSETMMKLSEKIACTLEF